MKHILMAATAALAGLAFAGSAAAQQGVTDTTITLGSHTPLSGPLQPWGAGSTGAAQLVFAQVNAAGGIHGRQIELIVEDSAYLVPKATEAGRKLITDDGIFAMLLSLGTPHNDAVLPLQGEFDVPNLLPMTAARSMSITKGDGLPDSFGAISTYYDQIRIAVSHFAAEGRTAPCVIYLDTDFGQEILDGAIAGAEEAGLSVVETAAHQPGDRDYVGSLSKLVGAGCDSIYLGVNFPEAMAVKATAAQMAAQVAPLADMPIVGSTAIFEAAVVVLGDANGILPALEGLYAAAGWLDLADAKNPDLNPFAAEAAAFEEGFMAATGVPLVTGAVLLGHNAATIAVAALEAAGPDLNPDTLVTGMESVTVDNIFTGDQISYGPGSRQGSTAVYLSQIQNGAWSFVEKLAD